MGSGRGKLSMRVGQSDSHNTVLKQSTRGTYISSSSFHTRHVGKGEGWCR